MLVAGRRPTHRAALLTALSVAACATGGAGPTTTTAPQATTTAQQATTMAQQTAKTGWRALVRKDHSPPPKPWADMALDERKAYMRDVVVPRMEPLFLAYDAERYAGFGCRTCHGAAARERNYAMPNPDLFTLHPSGTPEQKRVVEEREEAARFMFNAVTPTMRSLLGAAPYDAATGTGFVCFNCHPNGAESL